MDKNQNQQLDVRFKEGELSGKYANAVQIGHTNEEFFLDFMTLLPPTGEVFSRVVMTPAHAKRFALALTENIRKYQEVNGLIQDESTKRGHSSQVNEA